MRRIHLIALCLSALSACSFPYDAEGTLDRVRGGILRVGVSERPPWVVASGGEASGVEPALAAAWADELGARVEWVRGSESSLVEAIDHGRVDLLIGGFAADTLWAERAAATQPYLGDRVMLVRAGESAFLFALDRFLAQARRSGRMPPEGGA